MLDIPHTPPSASQARNQNRTAQGPIPHFQLPKPPKTPAKTPAKKGIRTPSSKSHNSQLKTPNTGKLNKVLFGEKSSMLFPPTPDFTPHRSPRSVRKKRPNFDDLFALSTHMEMGMFLPNHASVGSGRKLASPMKSLKAPLALDLSELSQINENLTFEEDPYDDSIMLSPTKLPRRKKQALLNTPGGQLITDEKVKMWHGDSYHSGFSSDEESEFGAPGPKLINPFVTSTEPPAKKVKNPFNNTTEIDYSTHNEFINHRTGERKVEALLESQRKFKPKKIDFSGI
ncbi:CIC11C00000002780 [Sungouiella intermedia]|uniref:CIC11C00000002780 n=1 Tax=Sungouiella intermedia TaxID=45354 RepID=A0A1L0DEA2_9ASCO|nr:CIC11C00000002780 [[Candida] intermedia]